MDLSLLEEPTVLVCRQGIFPALAVPFLSMEHTNNGITEQDDIIPERATHIQRVAFGVGLLSLWLM